MLQEDIFEFVIDDFLTVFLFISLILSLYGAKQELARATSSTVQGRVLGIRVPANFR